MNMTDMDVATVMRALADPTRRNLYERIVSADEITVIELTRGGSVSQPAVSQHLRALKDAGLISERRAGRNALYRAEPAGLAPLVDWLGIYGLFWRERFANLGELLKEIDHMTAMAEPQPTREIVVEDVIPHAPALVWKTLTSSELIGRWLMPSDFEPVLGRRFTFKTRPMGGWDGVVHCEVLELIPNERLVYSWKGGSDDNPAYGARLDSIVTWTLTAVEGGIRLRLVHSGFRSPGNDFAFNAMSGGWAKVTQRIATLTAEIQAS